MQPFLVSSCNAKGDYCMRGCENALIFSYQVNRLSIPKIKPQCYPRYFLNSRNETHLARVSIFVHLVTDAYIYLSIYSISFILFYFISFYSILFIIFYRRSEFFYYCFFHLFCDNLPCSGMFRDVPECSMFRVLLTPCKNSKIAANMK